MGTEMVAWTPSGGSADAMVSAKVLSRIADSVPLSTRTAYARDWDRFTEWCGSVRRSALPCTPETLAEYASFMVDNGSAPATIGRALSSVRVIHRLGGHHPPDTMPARGVIRTYRKTRADDGIPNERPAAALSVKHLKKIMEALDGNTAKSLRDRLIIILGWAMMARRGELVQLNIADVTEVEAGLDVTIRKGKSDQAAAGRKVAIPYGSDPATCPVRLTRAWLGLLAGRGITEGPLFRRINSADHVAGDPSRPWVAYPGRPGSPDGRLTGAGVWRIVKEAARRAGVDRPGIQAHSLRAGGATGAYLGGADIVEIGRHGGWQDGSAVMLTYIRDVDRWKKNPMHGAGL